jgi:hypothetical protein
MTFCRFFRIYLGILNFLYDYYNIQCNILLIYIFWNVFILVFLTFVTIFAHLNYKFLKSSSHDIFWILISQYVLFFVCLVLSVNWHKLLNIYILTRPILSLGICGHTVCFFFLCEVRNSVAMVTFSRVSKLLLRPVW